MKKVFVKQPRPNRVCLKRNIRLIYIAAQYFPIQGKVLRQTFSNIDQPPWIVLRVSGQPHLAQESSERRSLHLRGRETKKFIFLSSSRLCLRGGAAPPWRFCRSAHEQTQAPRSSGLLLPKGAAEVFLKYTGCQGWSSPTWNKCFVKDKSLILFVCVN